MLFSNKYTKKDKNNIDFSENRCFCITSFLTKINVVFAYYFNILYILLILHKLNLQIENITNPDNKLYYAQIIIE